MVVDEAAEAAAEPNVCKRALGARGGSLPDIYNREKEKKKGRETIVVSRWWWSSRAMGKASRTMRAATNSAPPAIYTTNFIILLSFLSIITRVYSYGKRRESN